MSDPQFVTIAHGIDVPVVKPEHLATAPTPQGIAVGRILADGVESFAFTISHPDGTVLTAVLNEAHYARVLGLIARVTNSFNADHRAIRFGEHG